jgi:precorrin-2 methylase
MITAKHFRAGAKAAFGSAGNQMLESTKWQINQSLESTNCFIFT